MTEEDEAFEAIDKAQGWRKRQIEQQLGQPIYFKPRREWVGLTREQIVEIIYSNTDPFYDPPEVDGFGMAEDIEAKLKELNDVR